MSRELFLNDLKNALAGMKEEEIEGVLAYYGEMIDDRMEAGMSEEAAVMAMEPVQVIASRVLGETGEAREEKKDDKNKEIQEIRRPADSINELHVSAENKRVRVTSGDGNDVVLRYCIEKGDIFRLHEDDGVLTLEHEMRPMSSFVYEKANGDFSLDAFLGSVGKFLNQLGERIVMDGRNLVNNAAAVPEIEVILPRAFRAQLKVTTSNSRIVAKGITCGENVTLTTSNARIEMENCAAKRIRAVTNNGRIEMHEVYSREELKAMSSNGQIVAENASSDSEMHLTTSNGRIVLEDVQAQALYIKTSNGSVSGNVAGSAADYTVRSATSNASNNLVNRDGGNKHLSVITSNGSVNVTFKQDNL